MTTAAPPHANPHLGATTITDAQSAPQRIEVLDVLRGIALFGMLLVHFLGAAEASATRNPDLFGSGAMPLLTQVKGALLDTRFHAMFGILFGVGFAIQLDRADRRGEAFWPRYLRRLAGLAVFGLVAEGLFGYNVLLSYAIWGLPLLLVRRWPVRALVPLLLICAAWQPLNTLTWLAVANPTPGAVAELRAENRLRNEEFRDARSRHETREQSGDWSTVVASRFDFIPHRLRQLDRFPNGAFVLFLAGLILYRLDVFTRPGERKGLIAALTVGGIGLAVIGQWILPIGPPPTPVPQGDGLIMGTVRNIIRVNAFQIPDMRWLGVAYIGAVLLLVARDAAWLRRLRIFAWSGRTALTSYMIQVMVLDILFASYGVGLQLSPLLAPIAAAAFFLGLAMLSRWWLQRHPMGPLEWVWRSMTYGRFAQWEMGGRTSRVTP